MSLSQKRCANTLQVSANPGKQEELEREMSQASQTTEQRVACPAGWSVSQGIFLLVTWTAVQWNSPPREKLGTTCLWVSFPPSGLRDAPPQHAGSLGLLDLSDLDCPGSGVAGNPSVLGPMHPALSRGPVWTPQGVGSQCNTHISPGAAVGVWAM